MPRDGEKGRRRLQEAALKLFGERGYDKVTAADIAAEAGTTQRTFFRHFPDKREVLFGGEDQFIDALTQAISSAPAALGPWDALRGALLSVEPLFIENLAFSMPRQRLIASHPALQERAQTKLRGVMTGLTSALRERGVPEGTAALAAQMAMAAMNRAISAWFADETSSLAEHINQAFSDVRAIASASDVLH